MTLVTSFMTSPLVEPSDDPPHPDADEIQAGLSCMSIDLWMPLPLSSYTPPQRMDIVRNIQYLGHHLLTYRTLAEFWDALPADPPDEFFILGDDHHTIESHLLVLHEEEHVMMRICVVRLCARLVKSLSVRRMNPHIIMRRIKANSYDLDIPAIWLGHSSVEDTWTTSGGPLPVFPDIHRENSDPYSSGDEFLQAGESDAEQRRGPAVEDEFLSRSMPIGNFPYMIDPELAMAEADKVEDDEDQDLRKKLWLMVAKHVIQLEKGVKRENIRKAIAFLKETDGLLKIEDILPFFPDFALIDDFKEAICSSLEDYNMQIKILKEEMDDATHGADNIRSDITALAQRYAVVERDEECGAQEAADVAERSRCGPLKSGADIVRVHGNSLRRKGGSQVANFSLAESALLGVHLESVRLKGGKVHSHMMKVVLPGGAISEDVIKETQNIPVQGWLE
ncbi:hypothetical protein KSP39_PZI010158 [Platanthera zijinensis]|uniref:Uncharacterized protein n=1 Tax=Platanthera zijinensis TaxID=2320716 RepID=A0AAP0BIK4_9ASPA